MQNFVITNEKSIFTGLIYDAIEDSYKRLLAPSIEREMRICFGTGGKRSCEGFCKNTEKCSWCLR
jgi:uncharacterized protein